MTLDTNTINTLLCGEPITDKEINCLEFFRRYNSNPPDDKVYTEPLFAREVWYASVDPGYIGEKPPALPEVINDAQGGILRWIGIESAKRLRTVIMAEYLLSDDLEYLDMSVSTNSSDRVVRLEGELRRYGARESIQVVTNVPLSVELVNKYCENYNLLELKPLMLHKLGL